MVVKTQKGNNIPEGAVKLTREEALKHQKKFINNWPSISDVFTLRYAPYINGLSAFICGSVAFSHFSKIFSVRYPISVFTFAPAVTIPAAGAVYMTDRLLTDKVLLMSMSCPLCDQLKFTTFQLYNNALSPALLSFFFCHNLGSTPKGFRSFEGENFWKNALSLFKKGSMKFQSIALFQLGFSFLFPFVQNKQLQYVSRIATESSYKEELPNEFIV